MERERKKDIIRIAWIHNYTVESNPSSGVFMYQLYDSLEKSDPEVKIELLNIGNISNPILLLAKFMKYRKIFKKYDILHAQYGSGTGFFTSLFSKKKIITLRGSDWYYYQSENIFERFHVWIGCKLSRLSLSKFDRIIVMSERMKKEVIDRFSSFDIKVIPDGISLEKFYPSGVKGHIFRVLFSSINIKNSLKRYSLAEKSFNIFHSKYPDSELVFMTGVPHNEVNSYINSIDVILLTSTHEGWPNIIKEGLACNVPFVSTDVSDLGIIAALTDSCLVCEGDPESLALGLEKVYKKKSFENIRSYAVQFDINITAKKLSELYRELIK